MLGTRYSPSGQLFLGSIACSRGEVTQGGSLENPLVPPALFKSAFVDVLLFTANCFLGIVLAGLWEDHAERRKHGLRRRRLREVS